LEGSDDALYRVRSRRSDLLPVFLEVAAGDLGGGRIEPLHLPEAGQGCPQVSRIDGPGLVVVGQVAERAAGRAGLDYRER
jgi:hypothetical protein